ncbi:MAG: urease accessory protein UreF [Prochlorothrix sp.]
MTFDLALLNLLQLVSPTLPVGAYSYSEGLETLIDRQIIYDRSSLVQWLRQELTWGSIRLDAAIVLRAHAATLAGDSQTLVTWNQWLSAARETEELRLQHWQMGRSLLQLAQNLNLDPNTGTGSGSSQPVIPLQHTPLQRSGDAMPSPVAAPSSSNAPRSSPRQSIPANPNWTVVGEAAGTTERNSLEFPIPAELQDCCNFAIAFGLVAAGWHLDAETTLTGYLYSWASNLVSAAVRLVPLGQTEGQQALRHLHPHLYRSHDAILAFSNDELACCSWGLSLASMAHETQYSRLFRS